MRATAENPNIAQLRFAFGGREDLNQNDLNFALRMFAEQGNSEMVDFLLNVGYRGINADPTSPADDGYTAIQLIDRNIETNLELGQDAERLIACRKIIKNFLNKKPSIITPSCKGYYKPDHKDKDDENDPSPPAECKSAIAFSYVKPQGQIIAG